MKDAEFTEQQIAFILSQGDRDGEPTVEETCRRAGISMHTYLRLRARYGGLSPEEISRVHRLEDETKRLKRLLATLILERQAPQHVVASLAPAGPVGAGPARGPASHPAAPGPRRFLPPAVIAPKEIPSFLRRVHRMLAADFWRALGSLRRAFDDALARGQELVGGRRGGTLGLRSLGRGHSIVLMLFAVGVGAGFAFGLNEAPVEAPDSAPVPVDFSLRANSYGSVSSRIDTGWDRPQPWGTWMAEDTATILLGFDGPSRGDVELLVDARVQPPQGRAEQSLVVRFNDSELGRWRLPSEARDLRRRFIVPKDIFNRATAAELAFELEGDVAPEPGTFGLRAVALRDARFLRGFKGFVDSCSPNQLVGWAVAQDSAMSVVATVDGAPITARFANLDRPDLESHGLPGDAGFVLTPATPIPAGSNVEITFANGRKLRGSPCKP